MSDIRPFAMPKWGIEMSEGLLASWGVGEGQRFARGQVLAVIETDKISNDVEAEFDGVLARQVARPGETLPVGALLGVLVVGDASADEVSRFASGYGAPDRATASEGTAPEPPPIPAADADITAPAAPPAPPEGITASPAAMVRAQAAGLDIKAVAGSGRGGRITFQDVDQAARPPSHEPARGPVEVAATGARLDHVYASPLAKRLAVRHGVDLAGVKGNGPRGRIRKDDVLARVQVAPPVATAPPEPVAGEVEVLRMSPMRKAIARQLTLSKTTIPHFYLRLKVRTDALARLRAEARRTTGEAPSVNDYLVRAAALALKAHPDVNVQVHGEEIHRFAHADIAVAVATEKGLVTPIVRAAETKSVAALSREIRVLAERARAGRLAAEEYQGGSFSVSNLGMYGIESFDAVINPPQGAILAIGATTREMTEADGGFRFGSVMALSLSCDHRAIDGAVGARFLAGLKGLIEAPDQLTA